ncbi:MAG: hypothetical protein A2X12_00855 [Bacteroidetes bacterium GWE2_29_8]|nr:MAG: hypothetical protein A2X12_00855 [Bacteroidetes bacterium GWE2_29_8]OFY15627.1 MAG: hypothetical protein A2X02_06325 [Bacteroidetes bacterium GWF2_29_10]
MSIVIKEKKAAIFTVINDKLLELRKNPIKLSLCNFESDDHRLEFVAKIKGVDYVNDSKATNINSSWYSLEKMTKNIIWIIGSKINISELNMTKDLVRDKVKEIIYMGEENYMLENYFLNQDKHISNVRNIEDAVILSYRIGQKDNIVLFSPGCPSFDLYKNYAERGESFIKSVRNL